MPSLSRLDSWSSLIKTTIDPDDYYYWSWYLHRGSKITIDWSFSEQSERNDVIAYLVKSETGFDYFDSWTATANAFTSLLAKPYSKIYLESTNGELTFEVHEDDFYFVFFLNTRQESLSGYFKYNIDAMIYDLRHPDESCFLPCSLPVSHGDIIFLESPLASSFPSISGNSYNTDFEFLPVFAIKWKLIVFILLAPFGLYLIILWITILKNWLRKRETIRHVA